MDSNEKPPIWDVLVHYGLDGVEPAAGRTKVHCPFHDDSNPSASVDVAKQRFVCFACDMSHDAYSLVMQQEGVSFASAVERVEEITGVSRPSVSRSTDEQPRKTSLHLADRKPGADTRNTGRIPTRRGRRRLR